MAQPDPFDPSAYAQEDTEADRRYSQWRHVDPFPEIPPALLNTADLLDYIRTTAMISPFTLDASDPTRLLKPASCAIPLGGEYLYWEDVADLIYGGTKVSPRRGTIKPGDELILQRNSIVYAGLAPVFRIPDYIAARFNLTIENIYRGILVGTGPLVDPGFDGHLFVPLHNLTSNNYRLIGGEPIVWMEFTKLSPNEKWDAGYERLPSRSGEARVGEYVAFPERKQARRRLQDYTNRAADGPIMSSIPELVGRAQKSAEAAEGEARRIRNVVAFVSIGGLAALVIGAVALFFQVVGLVNDQRRQDNNNRADIVKLHDEVRRVVRDEKAQAVALAELQRKVAALKPKK